MPGLDALITSCHRWGAAVLAMPTETLQSRMSSAEGKLHSLNTLILVGITGAQGFPTVSIFKNAQKLRRVYFCGSLGNLLSNIQLPESSSIHITDKLQYFQGAETAPLGDLSILRSPELRPRLTTLEIPIDKLAFASETLFPNVRALRVKYDSSLYFGTAPLPHDIRMPALEELNINTHDSASGETFHIPTWALSMLSSNPTFPPTMLTSLCIRGTFPVNIYTDISNILCLITNLIRLDMSIPSDESIQALADVSENMLVPCLEICNFYINSPLTYNSRYPLNLLASKRCEKKRLHRKGGGFWCNPIRELAVYLAIYRTGDQCEEDLKSDVWIHVTAQIQLSRSYITTDFSGLMDLRRRLLHEMPELAGRPPRFKPFGSHKWQERVHQLLNIVDEAEIPHMPNFYASVDNLTLELLEQIQHTEKYPDNLAT